jgi:hypothetical protein
VILSRLGGQKKRSQRSKLIRRHHQATREDMICRGRGRGLLQCYLAKFTQTVLAYMRHPAEKAMLVTLKKRSVPEPACSLAPLDQSVVG